MSITPVLIAPFQTGVDTDREPWLAPADSFQEANNVHIQHGYLQKRNGYTLFATLSGGTRVLGIWRYVQSDGSKETLAFDTTTAYLYNSVSQSFGALEQNTGANTTIFNSGETDYIWSVNWQYSGSTNALYFTNGKAWDGVADPNALNGIRFYPGSGGNTKTGLLTPSTGGGNTLYGGKLLFTLGQRLIVLYTYENSGAGTNSFPQRARWCAKQNVTNWDDTVGGGGDFADAATGDQIISAQALQNQIIVFFTNSVWSLLATSDPNKAFRWVRLNNFRACDGKMASVAYDRTVKALGIRGITSTDGSQTKRIDSRIQDFTYDIINIAQFEKVFCFRSYETTRWWTLFSKNESEENNGVLIYDDDSQAFTFYDINFTCLGYGNAALDYGLDDFSVANNLDYSLNDMGDDTLIDWYWDQNQDIVLAGDTSGNIYQADLSAKDNGSDINASFTSAGWNPFQTEGREAQMVFVDLYVDTDKETTGTVEFYKNDEVTPYATQAITFLPNLNYVASISDISRANPVNVEAPQHGLTTGDPVYIYGVTGMEEINSGNGNVITVVDEDNITLDGVDSSAFSAYEGSGAIYLKEFYQTKSWIRAYGGGIGYLHWIKVELSGGNRPFRIHALKPAFRPRGKRTIN